MTESTKTKQSLLSPSDLDDPYRSKQRAYHQKTFVNVHSKQII